MPSEKPLHHPLPRGHRPLSRNPPERSPVLPPMVWESELLRAFIAGLLLLLFQAPTATAADSEVGSEAILRPTRIWLRMSDAAPIEAEPNPEAGWIRVTPRKGWQNDWVAADEALPTAGWYRLEFVVEPEAARRNWTASAGFVGNSSELFFNRVRLGRFGRRDSDLPVPQRTLHAMPLPPGLLVPGTNWFDIRFHNHLGLGGMLGGPVGLIPAEVFPEVRSRSEFGRELFRGLVGGAGIVMGLAFLLLGPLLGRGALATAGLPFLLLGLQTLLYSQSMLGNPLVPSIRFALLFLLPLSFHWLGRRLIGSGKRTDLLFHSFATLLVLLALFVYPNPKAISSLFGLYLLAFGSVVAFHGFRRLRRFGWEGWALVSSIGAFGVAAVWDMALKRSPSLDWAALWWDPVDWATLYFLGSVGAILIWREIREGRSREALAGRMLATVEARGLEIARRLHNEVVQDLDFLKVRINDLRPDAPAALRDRGVGDIAEGISECLQHLHQVTETLRPIQDQGLSLTAALKRLEVAVHARYRLPLKLVLPEPCRLGSPVEDVLYRAAAEITDNACRHSGGTSLRLAIEVVDGRVEMRFEDNGKGFSVPPEFPPQSGLARIRDRILWRGGTFEVESSSDTGTRIQITLPTVPA